jgi:hypothetical protein
VLHNPDGSELHVLPSQIRLIEDRDPADKAKTRKAGGFVGGSRIFVVTHVWVVRETPEEIRAMLPITKQVKPAKTERRKVDARFKPPPKF